MESQDREAAYSIWAWQRHIFHPLHMRTTHTLWAVETSKLVTFFHIVCLFSRLYQLSGEVSWLETAKQPPKTNNIVIVFRMSSVHTVILRYQSTYCRTLLTNLIVMLIRPPICGDNTRLHGNKRRRWTVEWCWRENYWNQPNICSNVKSAKNAFAPHDASYIN